MANQRWLRLRSLEHLATAQSYQRKRQEHLITLRPRVPQFSQRPIRPLRIRRTTSLGPCSRITSLNRTVRRRLSLTLDRNPAVRNQIGPKRIVCRQRSQTVRRKRTVRRSRNRIIGRFPTGMSLLSGRKLPRRASVRSLRHSAPLLLRKRGLHRSNNNARSLRRRSRKRRRRSNRTKSRSETRSRRSNRQGFGLGRSGR